MPVEYRPLLAVCGHVGTGHAHSHGGFVQDDSVGFAVAIALLAKYFPVNTRIQSVDTDLTTDTVRITTSGGGRGQAVSKRGFTPQEKELMARAVGKDSLCTQALTSHIFGRVYGQGAMEQAVAFQQAVALAVADTFAVEHADKLDTELFIVPEDLPGQTGCTLASCIPCSGVPVAVMATINATYGGIGPVEDMEGNILLGLRGRLMRKLGLDKLPTIIIEAKQYIPGLGDMEKEQQFLVRYNEDADNTVVGTCLTEALQSLETDYIVDSTAYPRHKTAQREATHKAGVHIAALGKALAGAETAREKVQLAAELAAYVSQDVGGISFMSNAMHACVGGAGIMPGTAAVLSLLVNRNYISHWRIPVCTHKDIKNCLTIIEKTVPLLAQKHMQAMAELYAKALYDEKSFRHLL